MALAALHFVQSLRFSIVFFLFCLRWHQVPPQKKPKTTFLCSPNNNWLHMLSPLHVKHDWTKRVSQEDCFHAALSVRNSVTEIGRWDYATAHDSGIVMTSQVQMGVKGMPSMSQRQSTIPSINPNPWPQPKPSSSLNLTFNPKTTTPTRPNRTIVDHIPAHPAFVKPNQTRATVKIIYSVNPLIKS